MGHLDPNVRFFGHLVDASTRIDELKQFLEQTTRVYRREVGQLEEYGIEKFEEDLHPLFANTLPDLLHSVAVIAAVSILDQELRGFAHVLQEEMNLPLRMRDLRGTVVERFEKYAVHVGGLAFQLDENDWEDVKAIFEIRNCLVHAGGDLGDFGPRNQVARFAKTSGIDLGDGDWIELNEAAAAGVIDKLARFVDKIFAAALEAFPGLYGRT